MSLEFFIKASATGASGASIMGSQGDPFAHDSGANSHPALQIFFAFGGTSITCQINDAGVVKSATSAPASYTLNVTHFISCDWDGTNLRLFQDGNLMATTAAAAGSITQPIFQNFIIGGNNGFLLSAATQNPFTGSLDSIRVSRIARHIAPYTAPTAKLTSDGNTSFLLNFDDQTTCTICTKVQTSLGGPAQVLLRRVPDPIINGLMMDNLTIQGPTYIGGPANSTFRRMTFTGAPYSFYNLGNIFNSYFQFVTFSGGGASCIADLALTGASGILQIDSGNFQQCAIDLAAAPDGSGLFNMPTFDILSTTQYGILYSAQQTHNTWVFNAPVFTDEGGALSAVLKAEIAMTGPTGFLFNGGTFENNGNGGGGQPPPLAIVDLAQDGFLTFRSPNIRMQASTNNFYVSVSGLGNNPIVFDNLLNGTTGILDTYTNSASSVAWDSKGLTGVDYLPGTVAAANNIVCFSANNTVSDCPTSFFSD
jgi:hypothetical protein